MAVRGDVDAWHSQALEDMMEGFILQDAAALTLDVSQASFSDVESISNLVRMLRTAQTEMKVTTVASGKIAEVLGRANLSLVVADRGTDEQSANTVREYLTSRRMAPKTVERELPLAA